MISPEVLRRYPFFGRCDDAQLTTLAMLADEKTLAPGETVIEAGQPADRLYLLMNGSVDLFFILEEENRPEVRREFPVGEVNPGEPFGISALIEPYRYTTTARAAQPSRAIAVDAAGLRAACTGDQALAYWLMQAIAKATLERLNATRVQLAAAWA